MDAEAEELRRKLYTSVEARVECPDPAPDVEAGDITPTPTLARVHDQALAKLHPNTLITSHAYFLGGTEEQLAECAAAFAKGSIVRPSATAIGRAVLTLQRVQHPGCVKNSAVLTKHGASGVTNKRCNANPTHFGKRKGRSPDDSYKLLLAYDELQHRAVCIVKVVPFQRLRLPMIYHKVVVAASGAVSVHAQLVTERGAEMRKPRARASGKRAAVDGHGHGQAAKISRV